MSGQLMGQHIASLVPSGDVTLFIATPGALNLQPRIDGALDTLNKHSSISTHTVPTGAAQPVELPFIKSLPGAADQTSGSPSRPSTVAHRGDGPGDRAGQPGLAANGVKAGGDHLIPPTEQLARRRAARPPPSISSRISRASRSSSCT